MAADEAAGIRIGVAVVDVEEGREAALEKSVVWPKISNGLTGINGVNGTTTTNGAWFAFWLGTFGTTSENSMVWRLRKGNEHDRRASFTRIWLAVANHLKAKWIGWKGDGFGYKLNLPTLAMFLDTLRWTINTLFCEIFLIYKEYYLMFLHI